MKALFCLIMALAAGGAQAEDYGWDSLRRELAATLAAGQSSDPFATPDSAGLAAGSVFEPKNRFDRELYLRFAQLHAVGPQVRMSTPPWKFLANDRVLLRNAVILRRKFARRFVDESMRSSVNGEPILRSLAFNYPKGAYESVDDEMMLGRDLLIAPVLTKGAKSRDVVLPPGRWRDDAGIVHQGPKTVSVETPLERLPYFVREKEPGTVCFASWNIGHMALGFQAESSVRKQEASVIAAAYRGFLEEVNPDIVGLCEYADAFTADGTVKTADAMFPGWTCRRVGPWLGYSWNAQYFRMEDVGEARIRHYSKRYGRMYYIATPVKLEGEEVVFVETHLDWNTLAPGKEDVRRVQMQELIEDFKNTPRVVIAGDFNVGHRFKDRSKREIDAPEEYEVFKKAGYVLGNDNAKKTCNAGELLNGHAMTQDNIIVKGLEISDFRVWPRPDLSDHALVSAVLKVKR